MVVFASLMGALSPFCSCGVIPIIAALLACGVPLAPVMAFWLASPLMDPSMFVITAGVLGLRSRWRKRLPHSAVGLLGGFGLLALQRFGLLVRPSLQRQRRQRRLRRLENPQSEGRRLALCGGSRSAAKPLDKSAPECAFPRQVAAARLRARKPDDGLCALDLVGRIAGDGGLLSILGATLVGIPSYLNGNAALPLVAGLIDKGMAPGAAMAFLVGGGVTSIPAALAVLGIARRQVFAAYLAFAILGALLSGVGFQIVAG